jgi:hypothetical protein
LGGENGKWWMPKPGLFATPSFLGIMGLLQSFNIILEYGVSYGNRICDSLPAESNK